MWFSITKQKIQQIKHKNIRFCALNSSIQGEPKKYTKTSCKPAKLCKKNILKKGKKEFCLR